MFARIWVLIWPQTSVCFCCLNVSESTSMTYSVQSVAMTEVVGSLDLFPLYNPVPFSRTARRCATSLSTVKAAATSPRLFPESFAVMASSRVFSALSDAIMECLESVHPAIHMGRLLLLPTPVTKLLLEVILKSQEEFLGAPPHFSELREARILECSSAHGEAHRDLNRQALTGGWFVGISLEKCRSLLQRVGCSTLHALGIEVEKQAAHPLNKTGSAGWE
ncbi:hypothetical protein D7V77_18255 [Corallococcus sp. CA041A]|nr:hypothetical protein D7V77_18255 [Corallococcus sp. CA041A]